MYVYALYYRTLPDLSRETRELGIKGYVPVNAISEPIARYVVEQMHPGYKYHMLRNTRDNAS